MTIKEFTKDGKPFTARSGIKPTPEMQEIIDELWNTVRVDVKFSPAYAIYKEVENCA